MKNTLFYLIILLGFTLASCSEKVDPDVDTLYMSGGSIESQNAKAISELYDHYAGSTKDKAFYEIVSEKLGRFILNYYPSGKILTVCVDPGSGWSRQFKNVDEAVLRKLSDDRITLDEIGSIGSGDSTLDSVYVNLLPINDPFMSVKTNGTP